MASARDESWAQGATQQLAAAGYRRGGARTAVVEFLDRQSCVLTAQEIESGLRKRGRAVARASIYRTLEQLEELGLVQRIDVGDGVARFEPARGHAHHHHHLVCDVCGGLTPFSDDDLERAIDRVSASVTFTVAQHDIVLRGACRACTQGSRRRRRR